MSELRPARSSRLPRQRGDGQRPATGGRADDAERRAGGRPLGDGAPAGGTARAGAPGGSVVTWLRDRSGEPYVQLLAAQLLVGGVAALANVLMARALAPAGRGEIALLLQIAYLAAQGVLLGTERSFVAGYFGASPSAAVRAYTRLMTVPALAAVALVVAFGVVAPSGLHPGGAVLALVTGYALVQVLMVAMRAVAIATDRVGDFLRCTVAEEALLIAAMVLLYRGGVAEPGGWLLAYLLAGAVPTLWCWIAWSRRAGPGAAAPDGRRRAVRREGLALLPSALANTGMLRVDRLALPALASTAALGLYAAVATLTELLAWPLRAYADSRLGRWRAAHRDGRLRIGPLVASAVGYTVVVAPVLAGGLYLLIVPVLGERYAAARVLVLPLVAAAGLYAVSRVGLGLLIARGRNGLVSAAEICGFAVSFAGYLVLIPRYGILGAAYGSLLGYGACLCFTVAAIRLAGSAATVSPAPAAVR